MFMESPYGDPANEKRMAMESFHGDTRSGQWIGRESSHSNAVSIQWIVSLVAMSEAGCAYSSERVFDGVNKGELLVSSEMDSALRVDKCTCEKCTGFKQRQSYESV
jgi:hypothetical protein